MEDIRLGEGAAAATTPAKGLAALDDAIIKAMEASDQIKHSEKVCKAGKADAAAAKKANADSIARNENNKKMKVRRDGEAKKSNEICSTTKAKLKNTPDDIS